MVSGVEVQKRTDESAREDVRLGFPPSQFYDFGHKKRGNFKDHALTDELGICPTRVIHALAGGARGRE